MSTWRDVRIRDIAAVFDGPHATPQSVKTASAGSIFLGISSLQNGRLDLAQSGHLSEEDFRQWTRRVTPQAGDVVFSYETRLGQAALVPDGLRCALGRRLALMRVDRDAVDPRFLLYGYLGPEFQEEIRKRTIHGSTVDRISLNDFPDFPIKLPALNVQRGVAATLGALDDKIESNHRSGDLTAALVGAQFRAEAERAHGVVPLASVATFTKGVSYRSDDLKPSSTALVTLKSFVRTGGYTSAGLKPYAGPFKEAQRLHPGDVAIAQTDLTQAAEVVGRVVRVPADARFDALVASLDLVIVRGVEGVSTEFLFGLLQQPEFREHCRARTSGTTVLHLASDAAPTYLAPDISPLRQKAYADLVRPLLERRDSFERESRKLENLRDALLPELMSGRMRVPEAWEAARTRSADLHDEWRDE